MSEAPVAPRSSTATAPPVRVLMLPNYEWNPYPRLLGGALADHGIEVTYVRKWPRRRAIVGAWRRAGKPEVVHLHWLHDFLGGSQGTPSRRLVHWFDWQLRYLKARGVRLVWTVHNLKGHEAGTNQQDAEAHRRMIERADAMILHCEAARDALIELYQPSVEARRRMHVLEHGNYIGHHDVDADPVAARAALDLPADARVFAFVGAVRGYKGVGDLAQVFGEVDELGADARLLIAGQPLPRGSETELVARAASDPRITLQLRRIPKAELSEVVRAADVVVLPFRDILTSGSAILALSHGRPIIAPALGCLPGTIPADASILYDPDAPEGLADALRTAATADLATMGERARAYAETIDWGPIAAQTARLYRGEPIS